MRSIPIVGSKHAAVNALLILSLSFLPGCRNLPNENVLPENATTAIINGAVWTGARDQPTAEAVLVSGNRISFVGSTAEVLELAGAARIISAEGGSVLPGFIDSHVHLLTGGYRLSSVQLRDAVTPEEFASRIADFAATVDAGEWITGGDWDHELWGGRLPHREWIDDLTPENPVWINRLDGHMALANSVALRLAGVDEAANVPGGTIVRDAAGVTGILKDNAMNLVDSVTPTPSLNARVRALKEAMAYLAEQGVTSVHDMSGEAGSFEAIRALWGKDSLETRIYLAEPLARWEQLRDRIKGLGTGDAWFRIGGTKAFVDGSLGSHTAAFFDAFDDAPLDRGLLVVEPETLYADMVAADAAGLQLMVHAIGDRANAIILDLYDRLNQANGVRDRRARVEHAQHLRRQDIVRFAELDVIASMQPYHAIDDGRWAERLIGPRRANTTYAFESLARANARLAFGSDWFVAPPTPLEGIYAAVTRRTLDGRNPGGWIPDERLSLLDALIAYTSGGAYAEFQDEVKGTIEIGKLADIVILDSDIFATAPEEIVNLGVTLTMVDGRVVFEREE